MHTHLHTRIADVIRSFLPPLRKLNGPATGHGAFEVLVNKSTGAVFPEYGPAMMWNTQYGMMRGMLGYHASSEPMTVSPPQATWMATHWLHQNQPGATTEAPEQFPSYYTVHLLKNDRVTGMLSVNGYSGQVWYHTWHDALDPDEGSARLKSRAATGVTRRILC